MINAIRTALAISYGATAGALARYYFTEFIKNSLGKDYGFLATFMINFTGCILIGFLLTPNIGKVERLSPEQRLLLVTGFCGAFTTFSGYSLETTIFIEQQNFQLAFNYWFGSIVMGILGVILGIKLSRSQDI